LRRTIITLLAAAALAAGAQPSAAQATCAEWQLRAPNAMYQSNGWTVDMGISSGYWYAYAYYPGENYLWSTSMSFSSATADLVQFTIAWSNGTGAVYTGFIDDNGFVEGTAADRWNPQAQISWRMRDPADCLRR
jgi:hypothetical protein